MDLAIIGKFIQERRKEKKLTQVQLSEILRVSEKTISKWESGRGFPDTTLMLPLCKALDITANELLSGKLLPTDKEYREIAEQNLITLNKIREKHAKQLLTIELLIIWFSISSLFLCCILAKFINIYTIWKVFIVIFGFINCLIGCFVSLIIETKVGFYQCKLCQNKYIPTYKQMLWSMHMGRTRYMKCPKCGKKSWSKKVVSNNNMEINNND